MERKYSKHFLFCRCFSDGVHVWRSYACWTQVFQEFIHFNISLLLTSYFILNFTPLLQLRFPNATLKNQHNLVIYNKVKLDSGISVIPADLPLFQKLSGLSATWLCHDQLWAPVTGRASLTWELCPVIRTSIQKVIKPSQQPCKIWTGNLPVLLWYLNPLHYSPRNSIVVWNKSWQ